MVRRAISKLEQLVLEGVADDLTRLKEAAGNPSLRQTCTALGWEGTGAAVELGRYLNGERVAINMKRYFALVRYYFDLAPRPVHEGHPANELLRDPVVTGLIKQRGESNPAMLYEYLGMISLMARYGQVPMDHPGVKLWIHLTAQRG